MHTLSTRPPRATVSRSASSRAGGNSGAPARYSRALDTADTTTRSAAASRPSPDSACTVNPAFSSARSGPGSPATTAKS